MSRFGFLFLFAALALHAQVYTGSISGYVLDPSARAIPNVGVTLEDTARSVYAIHANQRGRILRVRRASTG